MALAVVVACAAPARGFVNYDVDAGWFFPGFGFEGILFHQGTVPPLVASSVGNFSFRGALCPPLGTTNYLCGFVESRADLLGTPARLLSLHSAARLTRHDGIGVGSSDLAHADTRIEIFGMAFAGVAPPVGYAVFNFGLAGTVSSPASAAGRSSARGFPPSGSSSTAGGSRPSATGASRSAMRPGSRA